jgi:hypothetical protein
MLARHSSGVVRSPNTQRAISSRQVARRFGWITGAEGAAILLAVVVLNAVSRPDYIPSVIALIVGLHFFPLAKLFGAPTYYVTGLLGSGIGVAGLLIPDPPLRNTIVGLSFGLLLWTTAAALLVEIIVFSGT